ncbi:uncharacterized protein VTP21DRAFT_5066 [Calcarisporiella thermophila]|uniref:uncharacterized protein n=1 Tax=Calcarisporiella thermophila TaxID=911321 RepID=UPI003741FE3C
MSPSAPIFGFIHNPVTKQVNSLYHVQNIMLLKCCGCMHLRAGSIFICFVWATISLWFCSLSFMRISPFYSYFYTSAIVVFGVINLLFFFVCIFGVFALLVNSPIFVRSFSHGAWSMVGLFLLVSFINQVLFLRNREDFMRSCVEDARSVIQENFHTAYENGILATEVTFSTPVDTFNCGRLWVDEVKFSSLAFGTFFVFYLYWAAIIWSYSHKRQLWLVAEASAKPPVPVQPPGEPPVLPEVPPPQMPFLPGMAPFMPEFALRHPYQGFPGGASGFYKLGKDLKRT